MARMNDFGDLFHNMFDPESPDGMRHFVNRHQYYMLDDDRSIKSPSSFMEWATWFEASSETDSRRVAGTWVVPDVFVSTVFLGINHRFDDDGPPILFETMIFGGDRDQKEQWRYCAWEEAEEGHKKVVASFVVWQEWLKYLLRLPVIVYHELKFRMDSFMKKLGSPPYNRDEYTAATSTADVDASDTQEQVELDDYIEKFLRRVVVPFEPSEEVVLVDSIEKFLDDIVKLDLDEGDKDDNPRE